MTNISNLDMVVLQNIHQIDQKGKLVPTSLTIETKFFTLNIGKLEHLLLSESSSPNSSPSSSISPNTTALRKNSCVEPILLVEVQEFRIYEYDSKAYSGLISRQSWKNLKKGIRNNFTTKVLEIFYGNEFNLKQYKFLVGAAVENVSDYQSLMNELNTWKLQVEGFVSQVKSLGYFNKLDLWYSKQFRITTETCKK